MIIKEIDALNVMDQPDKKLVDVPLFKLVKQLL